MRFMPVAALAALLVPVPAAAQDYACAVPASAQAPQVTEEVSQLRSFATGSGITVAVIDTGVAAHPELRRLRGGRDFVGEDPLFDCDSHGTVVAGVIAGATTGIAPGAEVVSVRQTSAHYRDSPGEESAAGNLRTLAEAIHNALDEGARVINISVVSCVDPGLAARIDDAVVRDALTRAEREGAVVVAAAGNASPDCEPGFTVYPAHYPTVLAVAARDDAHTVAGYSLGATLSAEGHVAHALSSRGAGWADGTLANDGVRAYQGTSFAAPVVSGAVALLLSRHPHLSPAEVRELVHAAAQPGGGAVTPIAVLTQLRPDAVAETPPLSVEPADARVSRAGVRLGNLGVALLAAAALALAAAATRRRSEYR